MRSSPTLDKEHSRILFWGVGSIGSLFGGLIHHEGYQVYLLGRDPHISIIKAKGLEILERTEPKLITTPIDGTTLLEPSDLPFDVVFVTCKARDNIVCASELETKHLISKRTKLVIVQNGVGNEEAFQDLVPKTNVYRIITTEGALVTEAGKVMHSGPGKTLIGKPLVKNSYDSFATELNELLHKIGFESKVTNEITMKTWDKVLINAPINPIATVYNVTNGELLTRPHLRKLVEDLVEESIRILKSRNIPFDEEIIKEVWQVAKATAGNKNSMLQDIEKGRLTEIDFLNGRLLLEAELAGIPAPINKYLLQKIKELESNSV